MPEYFTPTELRALPDMGQTRYTDERVEDVAAYVVAVIEGEVGTSFVEREVVETLPAPRVSLVLATPYTRGLVGVKLDGVSQVAADFRLTAGVLSYADGREFTTPGLGSIEVTYKAGYSTTPPADIKEAALQATRARLMETDSNAVMHDRRSSTSSDGSTTTFVLPGDSGRAFGYPSVDVVVARYARQLHVASVF